MEYRAEIIDWIPLLKEYLFHEPDENFIEDHEFLPVYPGVKYPGILAAFKDKDCNGIGKIRRVDLVESQRSNILNPSAWNAIGQSEEKQLWLYEKKLEEKNIRYIQLSDFCYTQGKTNAIQCLKNIYILYPLLSKSIAALDKELSEKGEKLILSKKNVLLAMDINDPDKRIEKVDIENAYLISADITADTVAVERGNGKYELQNVYQEGAAYWISGYLLRDACHAEEILLHRESGADFMDTEMLKYSLEKLCGAPVKYGNNKRRSYEESVKRSINLIGLYLNIPDQKELIFENTRIINKFICMQKDKDPNVLFDSGLFCSIWAKEYLITGYESLCKEIKKQQICSLTYNYKIRRRTPKLYGCLADNLYQICKNKNELKGLKLLASGLFADCILIHLRMQVLECIHSFDKQQRESFIRNAPKSDSDMPLHELELSGKETLVTKTDLSLSGIYLKLLKEQPEEKSIRYITHLGWLVLFAQVCEIDRETEYIVRDTNQRKIQRTGITENLREVCQIIKQAKDEKNVNNFGYPFEDVGDMFVLWTCENVFRILECLYGIDEDYGIIVVKENSENYRQTIQKKRVMIESEAGNFTEPKQFCTFAKKGNGPCNVERDIENQQESIYTISYIGGQVAGISAVDRKFGEFLQNHEKKGMEISFLISKDKEEKQLDGTIEGVVGDTGEKVPDSIQQQNPQQDGAIDEIYKFQRSLWKDRANDRFFANAHRIALFQFRIDSSYQHPEAEKCCLKAITRENDSQAADEIQIKIGRKAWEEGSCAEFRRRELLGRIMDVCSQFDVDILLLPEYSVRPETVEWMRKTMDDHAEYKFSIWAGTYRIPVGYDFSRLHISEKLNLNEKLYWHSAPLPVITKYENKTEVIMKKFKKYPAVTLHEDINPAPAYELESAFLPIILQYAEEKMPGKARKDCMPFFKDARDDVMEAICAELLVMASISNYPSFLKESMCAYANYMNKNLLKDDSYEEYEKRLLEDMQKFGKFTAIYQRESRYLRTPILLVPACTTRAVDYYVFGQGFYLSAGLKTVFCNAVGTGGRGGSCFIGQDSWDDWKINKNEYLIANTAYHGLKPGIYMQASEQKDRGALGDKEQALLICDVNPDGERGKPNAESRMDALSVVAHIPVFEEKMLADECMDIPKCRKCNKYEIGFMKERREKTRGYLKSIIKHCKEMSDNKEKETYSARAGKLMSYDDSEMTDIIKSMISLGRDYQSEWLVRRAECYEHNYKMYPQAWPPPALTDWLYVEIDYRKFLKHKCDYQIQMPQKK